MGKFFNARDDSASTLHKLRPPRVAKRSISAAMVQSTEVHGVRVTLRQPEDVADLLNEGDVACRPVHVTEDWQLTLRLHMTQSATIN